MSLPGAQAAPGTPLRWTDGLRYGALGAPLAFAALPLYVHLPNHYATTLGVPLAGVGAVLLATRAWDALTDPWLGRAADGLLQRPQAVTWRWAVLGALLLGAGLVALFFPAVRGVGPLLAWCAAAMVVTSLGYSSLGVLHQAWGARLGGSAETQARLVGWREGLSLAGVLTASVLPALAGVPAMLAVALLLLVLGLAALAKAPYAPPNLANVARPDGHTAGPSPSGPSPAGPSVGPEGSSDHWTLPWRQPGFRRLLSVFLLNGIASAIPATLVLFFVRDRLQATAFEPLFLGGYFAAAGLAVPLWVRAVARHGLVRCWLASMLLAVLSFAWAAWLGPGDVLAFALVCLASGTALGADLVAPGALLAGVVQHAGHAQRHEGRYFGWWTCAGKLNLALAAGLALPLLQWMGYQPGQAHPGGLQALGWAYAVLPCAMKLAAAALLWHHRHVLEHR